MKKLKSIPILISIALLSGSLFAQPDKSIKPKPGPAPEFKIKEHQIFTLNNGLKIIVVENHKTSEIFYQLIVDVAPVKENEVAGYVSFAGNLMRSGTKNKTKAEIDEAIDFIGAEIHTSTNEISGLTLTKYKNEFLELFSDILLNPVFPEKELEKAIKQALSGLTASETEPEFIATRVGRKLRNSNHPYGEIVTEKSIKKITRELLINYYKAYYKPNVSYLIVVGDISLKDAKKDAEKYFGAWEKASVLGHEYQFPNKTVGTRVVLVHKDNAMQSYINITYPINLKTGDKDEIKAMLANRILGGDSFSSRLLTNLREDKTYTHGAYSSISRDPLVGYFRAFAQVGTEVTEDAVNQFITEMKRIVDDPVDNETFDLFKNIHGENFTQSLENPETIARFAFYTTKYGLPTDYYQTYLEKIESVTKAQIQEVSKKYIDPDQAIIVVVGDKNKLLDSLKKYSASGKVELYDVYGNPIKEEKKPVPKEITAQIVIDNYITASGGQKNLEKIQDITMVATTSMNGMAIKQKIYIKIPNKYAMIMSMNGNVMMQQTFDGERGIMKGFQGEQEILGEDLENLKIDAFLNAELNYNKLGVQIHLESIEKIEGRYAYKIKVVNPTGQTVYDFYDLESGLKVLSKQTISAPQGKFTQKQTYSDYQEIDGVKFPFLIKISGVQNMELKVESVRINTDLSDDLFQ